MARERTTKTPVIADVARLAGVSVPTVSRVLTGAARVAPEKRERVLAAIAELNYRPSAAARTLVTRRSRTIAVVAGNTSQYGYAEAIRGIEEEARAGGYTVTITVVETTDPEHVERALSLVLNQSPDGIAVLKFDPPGVAMLAALPPDLPVVALSGVRGRTVPQAVLDELHAAEALTKHLLSLGHATVHHVRVPPSRREDGRTTGWRRALKAAGVATAPTPLEASWEPESGRRLAHLLVEDPSVTAVFCGNDEIAMGVIKGITEAGKRVPEDISVVGFDDHPLARMWTPSLTTVRQDFAGLGRRGFRLLLRAMDGETGAIFSSERPELVLRESSAPPRTQG
ncbi:LacI family DNA-binding transcriptional regulator [Rathayibacter tanaceti]|uniref:Catabolite control protein A n=2 Tax=Rathayibacter tanaceti TaxID=1671680 RepID=A0A162FXF4_9MICO|nr:LacI family DNA-binding transcriptional regulator [Rathayibacter tanaceti]KZX20970.1 Catabolite control protein A [Rathayibacter tanaceti]QHC56574.1 substrate-binding domain-containing protein [Rathayibacter tanaceti]TCO36793.1 DNA-binding LacI/PurR family transcriptional regulator [Rathayibacter tanaceti]